MSSVPRIILRRIIARIRCWGRTPTAEPSAALSPSDARGNGCTSLGVKDMVVRIPDSATTKSFVYQKLIRTHIRRLHTASPQLTYISIVHERSICLKSHDLMKSTAISTTRDVLTRLASGVTVRNHAQRLSRPHHCGSVYWRGDLCERGRATGPTRLERSIAFDGMEALLQARCGNAGESRIACLPPWHNRLVANRQGRLPHRGALYAGALALDASRYQTDERHTTRD